MNKLFLSGVALLIVTGCSQGLSEKEISAAKVQADNLCFLAETNKDFAQKMADLADVHAVTHANSPSQQSERGRPPKFVLCIVKPMLSSYAF